LIDLFPWVPDVWGWKRAKAVDMELGLLKADGFDAARFGREMDSAFAYVYAVADDVVVGLDLSIGSGALYLNTVAQRNAIFDLQFYAADPEEIP
jgi:hypothetical protein